MEVPLRKKWPGPWNPGLLGSDASGSALASGAFTGGDGVNHYELELIGELLSITTQNID
jgi:hypothetical protein